MYYIYVCLYVYIYVGRDSSVGIANGYGLVGPWIESQWGQDFLHLFRQALGPTQPVVQWVPGPFSRGKVAGAWCGSPTPSCMEVKERVELNLYPPFWVFMASLRVNFTFTYKWNFGGPGSSVGIATDYGLDGLGIESRWGRELSHTSRLALGPNQPPVQWIPGLSQG
jgi:hypothetical protein